MGLSLTEKLIAQHCDGPLPPPGEPLCLTIDQTLTQDATGTLVMLELEALGLDRVRTDVSVQYVDHNLLQTDEKNADDHLFLESACRRFGIWYSRPGNGVSHPLHMQRFGIPGKTLLGSDSHTPAAGSLGMLALGAGGLDVAVAMMGRPLHFERPHVFGVWLTGATPDWVSAKDVILEMLRRHGVDGAKGMVIEYAGPGLASLSAMDRHVIANMGTELGATSTVFPSDAAVARFLESEGRGDDFADLSADQDAHYDKTDSIDLSRLVPLIATPSSPGNVVPVEAVEGEPIYQAYIGSSANPGYRDFAVPARMASGTQVPEGVSFDINPTSRQQLGQLMADGSLARLIAAGARLHQIGCNGCIGMGQAPATGRNSLRTVPRNFPGRSGTAEDAVFLCSPETATASALAGEITDPRRTGGSHPRPSPPGRQPPGRDLLEPLPRSGQNGRGSLVHTGHIEPLPDPEALPNGGTLRILLTLGDHISTDEILPAGSRVMPYRSSIPAISAFAFHQHAPDYAEAAATHRDSGALGHAIVAGRNFGQGSSREHAVLATRYLGLRLVLAVSISRIFRQNLVNFGVLPVTFANPSDRDQLSPGDSLTFRGLHAILRDELKNDGDRDRITLDVNDGKGSLDGHLQLDRRARQLLLKGGLISMLAQDGED